jgi:hypothetical protein
MDGVFRLWRIVNKDGNTSLTICNEIPCQGQIAGSIVGNSGKTIFVAHVADSRQIGFTSVMLP